jgi:hypothetical protein
MQDDRTVSEFDRKLGELKGLPDAIHSKPATIRTTVPIIGTPQTWVVTTVRQKEVGDTIFLERLTEEGYFRVFMPPKVCAAIRRQSDSLTDQLRKKAGQASAQARKERGEPLPFLKKEKVQA